MYLRPCNCRFLRYRRSACQEVSLSGKKPAVIAHRRFGNMIENKQQNMCHSVRGREVLQYEAVAGFEPSANIIGTGYSVAITRRLIHRGDYLVDWTSKFLSL